ncbi:MAG TPA: hypothetical protein VHK88_19315 [Aquihabitans sp.]|jgi:hypothetical protein|nr:hypothetical protein [Aquihabitans sp.]
MSTNPFPTERLVAVYPSRIEADAVARELADAGIDGSLVRVGDKDDEVAAMYGEMREETSQSWKLMPSAVVTKEQAKGSLTVIPICATVGLVLGLLVGLPDYGTTMPLWGRLVLGGGVGALFGTVVGMVIGGGLGARGPAERGAANGITVSVARTDDAVRRLLSAHEVVRIDRVSAGGGEIGVVETEEDRDPRGKPEQLRDRLHQPKGGDWSTMRPEEPRPNDPR